MAHQIQSQIAHHISGPTWRFRRLAERERSEREGQVACNRGLCGFWPEKAELAQQIANRLAERSRAAVSPKAEYVILS